MKEELYIPIEYNSLYYLYDYMNKEIYPCSKDIYESYSINKSLDNDIYNHKKNKKEIYQYPKISRKMIVDSLSNVSQIVLEVTERCNMNCIYCCYGKLYNNTVPKFHHHTEHKNNILGYLKTLLKLRKDNNIKSELRISFYGGEPLLRFDIISTCVDLSHEILPDVKITYGMTTNGLLLNKYIEYLVENNFSLLISIDGNKENNQYRILKNCSESFFRVEKNIEEIYNKYPTFFRDNVLFSTVLHNKNNCIDVMIFLKKWEKSPIFSTVSTLNAKDRNDIFFKNLTKQHEYTKEELAILRLKYPEIYKLFNPLYAKNISTWQDTRNTDIMDYNEILNKEKFIYPGHNCFLFTSKVFITVDGHILLCEKIARKFKFGKIINNKLYIYTKRVNQYYNNIQYLYNKKCTKCYKRYSCPKCFFAEIEDVENGRCSCNNVQAIEEIKKLLNKK